MKEGFWVDNGVAQPFIELLCADLVLVTQTYPDYFATQKQGVNEENFFFFFVMQ